MEKKFDITITGHNIASNVEEIGPNGDQNGRNIRANLLKNYFKYLNKHKLFCIL
jgi:hypothetical protein